MQLKYILRWNIAKLFFLVLGSVIIPQFIFASSAYDTYCYDLNASCAPIDLTCDTEYSGLVDINNQSIDSICLDPNLKITEDQFLNEIKDLKWAVLISNYKSLLQYIPYAHRIGFDKPVCRTDKEAYQLYHEATARKELLDLAYSSETVDPLGTVSDAFTKQRELASTLLFNQRLLNRIQSEINTYVSEFKESCLSPCNENIESSLQGRDKPGTCSQLCQNNAYQSTKYKELSASQELIKNTYPILETDTWKTLVHSHRDVFLGDKLENDILDSDISTLTQDQNFENSLYDIQKNIEKSAENICSAELNDVLYNSEIVNAVLETSPEYASIYCKRYDDEKFKEMMTQGALMGGAVVAVSSGFFTGFSTTAGYVALTSGLVLTTADVVIAYDDWDAYEKSRTDYYSALTTDGTIPFGTFEQMTAQREQAITSIALASIGILGEGVGVYAHTRKITRVGDDWVPSNSRVQPGDVYDPYVFTESGWIHILDGDINTQAGKLTGGMHTVEGVAKFAAETRKVPISATELENGVIRVTYDENAFNRKARKSMNAQKKNNPDYIIGSKMLFPKTWNQDTIRYATNYIVMSKNLINTSDNGLKTYQGTYKGVNVIVNVYEGKVVSVYPAWIQP